MSRLLSDPELCRKIGESRGKPISRSTLWRERKQPDFPKPVAITRGVRGTPENEVDSYLASRPRIDRK